MAPVMPRRTERVREDVIRNENKLITEKVRKRSKKERVKTFLNSSTLRWRAIDMAIKPKAMEFIGESSWDIS